MNSENYTRKFSEQQQQKKKEEVKVTFISWDFRLFYFSHKCELSKL